MRRKIYLSFDLQVLCSNINILIDFVTLADKEK